MEKSRLVQDWYTAREAAELVSWWRSLWLRDSSVVSVRTIRAWVARGHLTPGGLDEKGRQLFRFSDLAKAECTTRGRALRLAGIPENQVHPSRSTAKGNNSRADGRFTG